MKRCNSFLLAERLLMLERELGKLLFDVLSKLGLQRLAETGVLDLIMNITGNLISGQVSGDTAKQLSERFGKIMQDRTSFSINRSDTSISRSKQLDSAIPPSKISSLSSGEFVGMTADNPDQKIDVKAFNCTIINDHDILKKEEDAYQDIPVIRKLDTSIVQQNYNQIKHDVQNLVQSELERLLNNPDLSYLVLRK